MNSSVTQSETSLSGFLPYEEPSIPTIIVTSSFILLLNAVGALLDKLISCGLVGQILVGVAWGLPGANWLSIDAQRVIVQLGYLGLILLVYEGGLATSISSVRKNALLSLGVAAVGIALPIGLSFILMPLMKASPLQAFAAGAALCSTSLGTTFTVLSTSGLLTTRLGTILTTAAMLDDVVGLIMVQIVSNLGSIGGGQGDVSSSSSASGAPRADTIVRPIAVSIGLVVILYLLCRHVILPLAPRLVTGIRMLLSLPMAPLVAQTAFLSGVFVGSSYAGTSGLFAAYVAGAVLSWWDKTFQPGIVDFLHGGGKTALASTGLVVFDQGYAAVTRLLLKPFFFASIGFSIPVSQLFSGPVVWRGLVYAALMACAKLATGLWLCVRWEGRPSEARLKSAKQKASKGHGLSRRATSAVTTAEVATISTAAAAAAAATAATAAHQSSQVKPQQQHSIYPALLLGLAMTARGEIGYLIASVAQTSGIFGSGSSESGRDSSSNSATSQPSHNQQDIFLVVIWAVTVCTVVGPVAVGLLARRIRRLEERNVQEQRQTSNSNSNSNSSSSNSDSAQPHDPIQMQMQMQQQNGSARHSSDNNKNAVLVAPRRSARLHALGIWGLENE